MEVRYTVVPANPVNADAGANVSPAAAKTSWNVGMESLTPIVRAAGQRKYFERKDILRDVITRAAELLSVGDRALKFEMIEDADIYQLQVIDTTDGRVVRKIPPDEVVKIITHLKDQILEVDDHMDVLA